MTRERQRGEARKARVERRRQAVDWIAEGAKSQAEVARLLGVATRTVERWAASADFMRDVERVRREGELAAHHAAKKMAQRQHVPEPPHPDAVRAERQLMADAADALRGEMMARQRPVATGDAEILEWLLATGPASEVEWLDYRDAERGVVSHHARRRFEGRMCVPQVRILTF